MEIAIFGALDRYNYGDLLFPLILKAYLPENEAVDITYYGLIKSDMEVFGGVKTRPFSEFYKAYQSSASKNVIIIAGGCVLGANAGTLYSFLKHRPILTLCNNAAKAFHLLNPADFIAQSKLNITWGRFPFCPPKPNKQSLLIFNAVGDKLKRIPQLINHLKDADYLSVRNPILFDQLKSILDEKKIALSPDSATVMSKIWPRDSLKQMITSEAKNTLLDYRKGYIIFQAKVKTKRCISLVTQQLEELYTKTKLPILLLPIGRAYRHEDHVFLSQLAKQLDVPSQLINVTNLHDIMCLIANSTLFIGTSLHGNITAMSYAVPHLGVSDIPKLDQYLKFWDIEPNRSTGTVKLSQICDAALNALENTDMDKQLENAEQLSALAEKNLKKISAIVCQHL